MYIHIWFVSNWQSDLSQIYAGVYIYIKKQLRLWLYFAISVMRSVPLKILATCPLLLNTFSLLWTTWETKLGVGFFVVVVVATLIYLFFVVFSVFAVTGFNDRWGNGTMGQGEKDCPWSSGLSMFYLPICIDVGVLVAHLRLSGSKRVAHFVSIFPPWCKAYMSSFRKYWCVYNYYNHKSVCVNDVWIFLVY